MTDIELSHYVTLSALVFACGVCCITVRRNAVGMFMGVELMLNAANLNFVAFSIHRPGFQVEGQVFAILVIVMAAAEAAVALAIVLNFYNNRTTINVDQADELKH